VLKDP